MKKNRTAPIIIALIVFALIIVWVVVCPEKTDRHIIRLLLEIVRQILR